MLADLNLKSQVMIPGRLMKKLNLKAGDKLEDEAGRLVITPVIVIPRDQALVSQPGMAEKGRRGG